MGCNERDIYGAVRAVEQMGGGLAVMKDGEVVAALPVIPALKITNMGLVDATKFTHVPLCV